MSKLTPDQVKQANGIVNIRSQVIAEVLAMDGIPVDGATAAGFMILCVWSWRKVGWDDAKIARMLRNYADNIERGRRE